MKFCLAALLLVLALASDASAQPPGGLRRLPPLGGDSTFVVPLANDEPMARFASDPLEYHRPEDVLATVEPHVTAHKDGFFQKLSLTATPILRNGSSDLGIVETEIFAAFAVPAPTTDWPLLLIPTFETQFLDAPNIPEMPDQVFAALVDFMWLPKFGERWQGILSVSPGWYSDFQSGSGDGYRLSGRAIVRYDWHPDRLQLVLGALFLNRVKTKWIPAAGLIWKPSDDWSMDLVFPKAQIARRISHGPGFENWLYLAGGFGGNNWDISTDLGKDTLVLRDWRLSAGWELKRDGGAGLKFELGYVFFRDYEFVSNGVEIPLSDTVMFRGVAAF